MYQKIGAFDPVLCLAIRYEVGVIHELPTLVIYQIQVQRATIPSDVT